MTAAHRTRAFGETVQVCRQNNPKRCVIVRINDRGPFIKGRVIDLSRSAAEQLGIIEHGLENVMVHSVDSR